MNDFDDLKKLVEDFVDELAAMYVQAEKDGKDELAEALISTRWFAVGACNHVYGLIKKRLGEGGEQ